MNMWLVASVISCAWLHAFGIQTVKKKAVRKLGLITRQGVSFEHGLLCWASWAFAKLTVKGSIKFMIIPEKASIDVFWVFAIKNLYVSLYTTVKCARKKTVTRYKYKSLESAMFITPVTCWTEPTLNWRLCDSPTISVDTNVKFVPEVFIQMKKL